MVWVMILPPATQPNGQNKHQQLQKHKLKLIFNTLVQAQKPVGYGQEEIMVWLKVSILVSKNMAGNVPKSSQKHPVLLPQTWLEMSHGVLKISGSGLHEHGWRWPNFLWKISRFGLHKDSWKCPYVFLEIYGFDHLKHGRRWPDFPRKISGFGLH